MESQSEEELKRKQNIDAIAEELKRRNSDIPDGKNETVETDDYKKTTTITIKIDEVVTTYRKVEWKWGGTYYFKNGKGISQAIYYLDTK
jgi:hypothetical protein